MRDYKKVYDILNHIIDSDYLEDRLEYDLDDLAKAYPDLNEEEIGCLFCAIRDRAEFGGSSVDFIPPHIIGEYFRESIHNSFDGWDDGAKVILMSLIADMNRYARNR